MKKYIFKTDIKIQNSENNRKLQSLLIDNDPAKAKAAKDAVVEFLGNTIVAKWIEQANKQ